MPTPANPTALAQQARRSYVEGLLAGLPTVVQAVDQGARVLVGKVAEPMVAMRRRELVPDLQKAAPYWLQGMTSMLRGARQNGLVSATFGPASSAPIGMPPPRALAKVTISGTTPSAQCANSGPVRPMPH